MDFAITFGLGICSAAPGRTMNNLWMLQRILGCGEFLRIATLNS